MPAVNLKKYIVAADLNGGIVAVDLLDFHEDKVAVDLHEDKYADDLHKDIVAADLHEDIVAGREGDTDEDEEQVCHRQVQDQQVRCVLHLGVGNHLKYRKSHTRILVVLESRDQGKQVIPICKKNCRNALKSLSSPYL